MNYKVTDDSGSVPHGSIIPDQQKTNPCRQWPEPSDIHPFVEQFSELEDLFANHEIEYLKNNCESYPSSFDHDEFQELLDQIDLDDVRDKIDEEMHDSWTTDPKRIKDNLPAEDWTGGDLPDEDWTQGMYERKDNKIGMFGTESDIEQMIKYLDGDE